MAKSKRKLKENTETVSIPNNVKRHFLEIVSTYNKYQESLDRKSDIEEIAETLGGICEAAHTLAVNEADDWFDAHTVKRNMSELTKLNKEFDKVALDAKNLDQRLNGLYEDMGHILSRYYKIGEISENEMKKRLGVNESAYKGKEVSKSFENLYLRHIAPKFKLSINHLTRGRDGFKISANNDVGLDKEIINYLKSEFGIDSTTQGLRTVFIPNNQTISENMKNRVNESVTSEFDTIAKESKNFKEFLKKAYSEFSQLPKTKESATWLEDIYKSAKNENFSGSVNEAVKPFVNDKGRKTGDLVVTNNGHEYQVVYDGLGYRKVVGIKVPGEDTGRNIESDTKARIIYKKLLPQINKYLKRESINENFSSSDIAKIKDIVAKEKKLIGLTDPLKAAGFKDSKFSLTGVPHIAIKKGNKEFLLVNKKYVEDPDFVVGDIAGGLNEGTVKKKVNEGIDLKKADKKFKSSGTAEYQFKDKDGKIRIVTIEKHKSGYEVQVDGPGNFYKRTDGLRDVKQIQNWLSNINESVNKKKVTESTKYKNMLVGDVFDDIFKKDLEKRFKDLGVLRDQSNLYKFTVGSNVDTQRKEIVKYLRTTYGINSSEGNPNYIIVPNNQTISENTLNEAIEIKIGDFITKKTKTGGTEGYVISKHPSLGVQIADEWGGYDERRWYEPKGFKVDKKRSKEVTKKSKVLDLIKNKSKTNGGQQLGEGTLWPESKLSDTYEQLLSKELKKIPGVFYVKDYTVYKAETGNDLKLVDINPDKDGVKDIINVVKKNLQKSVNEGKK